MIWVDASLLIPRQIYAIFREMVALRSFWINQQKSCFLNINYVVSKKRSVKHGSSTHTRMDVWLKTYLNVFPSTRTLNYKNVFGKTKWRFSEKCPDTVNRYFILVSRHFSEKVRAL